jgi:hypothetical protein
MCFSFFLDNPFWGARNEHFRPWAAINFKCLVPALRNVKHNASKNNCLSSFVEQCSQKISLPPQGCAVCATWAEEIPWVLLGLRAQLGEDTGLSLAEAVLVLQLFCQMNFCKETKFPLTRFFFFLNLWMLLHFLCPGTIRVASCQASSRLISSAPASSGSGVSAWSTLSTTAPMPPPTPSSARDPVPSPSKSGRGRRSWL